MRRQYFYRNVRARDQLDLFFISAIGSLLATRLFLHLTGYPAIGSGGLHIAHVLWGGLLMLAGTTLMLSFIGMRMQRVAAVLSGAGFGLFIDEIGKFITDDNDYFYRPSVGIIYAIFVIIYLLFDFLSREQKLTSREYQLNALHHLEEAIVHDMDPLEKQRAHHLLAQANRRSPVTRQPQVLLDTVELVPEGQPRLVTRMLATLDRWYTQFWKQRSNHRLIRAFFIIETLAFVGLIIGGTYNSLDDVIGLFGGHGSYATWLLVGQLLSSTVAAFFAVVGAIKLKQSRAAAFEEFRRATLINLFLTEFFIFSRIEFEALPGFVLNVVILLFITYVLHQEQRFGSSKETGTSVQIPAR